jgi:hypothetical protein
MRAAASKFWVPARGTRGEEKIAVTPTISAAPFEWPEIHAPTPEELGLKDTLK